MKLLQKKQFSTVVKYAPLISLDLIVRDTNSQILLGLRSNRPAKGYWFVPGGRVRKGEKIADSLERLTKDELGVVLNKAKFNGIYQHFYDDSFAGTDFGTHYVVLAYELDLKCELSDLPKAQHTQYRWFCENELLHDMDVHMHTKWYFQPDTTADKPFTHLLSDI